MAAMRNRYCFRHVLPFTFMIIYESINVGLNTIYKAASNQGLSLYVFLTYSSAIATLVLLPSLFYYRRTSLPPLTFSIVGKLFLLNLVGITAQLLCYTGINYSSPTLASAMSNLSPACTFTLAIIFGMEKLALRSFSSQAKILGTAISISGAFIIVLYKGPSVIHLQSSTTHTAHLFGHPSLSSWIVGGLLLALQDVLTAMVWILQKHIITVYPVEHVVVFLNSIFKALISGVVAIVLERKVSAWALKLDLSLVAILYSGLLGSSLMAVVYIWIMHRKGPVYIAMFKPLAIVIAAVMGVVLLGDTLYLGSIIGAVVISFGFYAVLWGKVKEEMSTDAGTADHLESSDERAPLL